MLVLELNISKAKARGFEFTVSVGYIAKSYERKKRRGRHRQALRHAGYEGEGGVTGKIW